MSLKNVARKSLLTLVGASALYSACNNMNYNTPNVTIETVYAENDIAGIQINGDKGLNIITNGRFYKGSTLVANDCGQYNSFNGNDFIPINNFVPLDRELISDVYKKLRNRDEVVLTMFIDFKLNGYPEVSIPNLQIDLTSRLLEKYYDEREERHIRADIEKAHQGFPR